jgi:hypothetical protein
MAGQAASRTVPFGSDQGPQRCADRLIQVKAPPARGLNDPVRSSAQQTSLTAPEDKQP